MLSVAEGKEGYPMTWPWSRKKKGPAPPAALTPEELALRALDTQEAQLSSDAPSLPAPYMPPPKLPEEE